MAKSSASSNSVAENFAGAKSSLAPREKRKRCSKVWSELLSLDGHVPKDNFRRRLPARSRTDKVDQMSPWTWWPRPVRSRRGRCLWVIWASPSAIVDDVGANRCHFQKRRKKKKWLKKRAGGVGFTPFSSLVAATTYLGRRLQAKRGRWRGTALQGQRGYIIFFLFKSKYFSFILNTLFFDFLK